MRLFIAINFTEDTKEKMLDVQRRLREKGRGRFTSPENLHLTLAFLGEVPEERIQDIKSVMDSLSVPEMTLKFSKCGCFRRDSELWWIGVEENKDLSKLQKDLVRKLKESGFSPDDKRFRPHITLAREMHIGSVRSEELIPAPIMADVSAISLMLSHRVNGKLTYTEIDHKNSDLS